MPMWIRWIRVVFTVIGTIITGIGLIDLPDQLGKWHQLMIETGMNGEQGRWALVIAGLSIVFISSDLHRKLWARICRIPRATLPGFQHGVGEFISMKDAAHKLYTAAHISKSIWAKAAEEMSGSGVTRGSPEDLLNYIATHISTRISIYGKKAPCDTFGKISNDDVRASFFDEGATKLKDKFYDKSLYWTDLAVKSEDLNDLIADLQVQSGFDSHKS